jgi:hypothetical protein
LRSSVVDRIINGRRNEWLANGKQIAMNDKTSDAPDRKDHKEEVVPNQAMLYAMAAIEEIQKGMQPSAGKSSLEYLREARTGAMYRL